MKYPKTFKTAKSVGCSSQCDKSNMPIRALKYKLRDGTGIPPPPKCLDVMIMILGHQAHKISYMSKFNLNLASTLTKPQL